MLYFNKKKTQLLNDNNFSLQLKHKTLKKNIFWYKKNYNFFCTTQITTNSKIKERTATVVSKLEVKESKKNQIIKSSKKALMLKAKKELKTLKTFEQHPEIIRNLFLGTLIGGGYAQFTENAKTAINFHLLTRPEISTFIYNILVKYGFCMITNIKDKESRPHKFTTIALESLNELHSLFYRPLTADERLTQRNPKLKFIKKIPGKIEDLLNAPTFAFWFMQKGEIVNKNSKNIGATLLMHPYTDLEQKLLINALQTKLRLTSTVLNNKIIFEKKELPKLLSTIKPYVPADLYPKFGIAPVKKTKPSSSFLHLFYGPLSLTKIELINQLERNAQLQIKDFAIAEYSFGQGKAAFEVFISLKKQFQLEQFHLLNVTDKYLAVRTPVNKQTNLNATERGSFLLSQGAAVLALLEQQDVYNTFSQEELYKDLLEQLPKNFLFYKNIFEQLPNKLSNEELYTLIKLLPDDVLKTNKKESLLSSLFPVLW